MGLQETRHVIHYSDTEMMDLSALDVLRREVGDETLAMLVQAFIDDVHDHVTLFSDLLTKDDFSMLAIKSHAFKSASFSFGAMQLGHMSKAIEMAINDEKTETLSDLLNSFSAKAHETVELYNGFLSQA